MISGRCIADLVGMIRKDKMSLDVYDVKVWPPGGEGVPLMTPVELTLQDGDLCCQIRLLETSIVPEPLGSLFGKLSASPRMMSADQCYRISGTTSDGTDVALEEVWPQAVSTTTTMGAGSTHLFHFNKIHLPARGMDAQDVDQILEQLRQLDVPSTPSVSTTEPKEPPNEELIAIIPGVELLIFSHGTESKLSHPYHGETSSSKFCCLMGEVLGGTFCLEGKDGDLWVFYRRNVLENDLASPPTRQVFSGILDAVGFMHACQPWPYFLEHRVHHRVTERWVSSCKQCQKDTLTPMSKVRLDISCEARELFLNVAEFFAKESKDADLFKKSLWLMREACRDGMPFEIRLITLCSVIEGLIHHFEKTLLSAEDNKLTRREKWSVIMNRLGLPWEGTFDAVYEKWDFFRHPLAHGFQKREGSSGELTFQAYSRITGAIYLLMASRMGYTGAMDSSVMEGGLTISIVDQCEKR